MSAAEEEIGSNHHESTLLLSPSEPFVTQKSSRTSKTTRTILLKMPAYAGRISPAAFKGVIGALFGLAILTAAGRTLIRIQRFRRLFVDDGFLLLAVVCLCVSVVFTYVQTPYMYTQINVEAGIIPAPSDILDQLVMDQKYQDTAAVFTWTVIYAVKFSFLFFFRYLIRRQRTSTIHWWVALAILIPAYVSCVVTPFIACATFGPDLIVKCDTPASKQRQTTAVNYSVCIDVLTDALLISIPIVLLWRVQISLRQKLALCAILSLSIVMIVFAIIRVAAADTIHGIVDTTWLIFWFSIEECVAVIMVSLSAFRTLFVRDRSKPTPYTPPSSRKKRSPNMSLSDDTPKLATISQRAVIRERGGPRSGSYESEEPILPIECRVESFEGIRIDQDIEMSDVNCGA